MLVHMLISCRHIRYMIWGMCGMLHLHHCQIAQMQFITAPASVSTTCYMQDNSSLIPHDALPLHADVAWMQTGNGPLLGPLPREAHHAGWPGGPHIDHPQWPPRDVHRMRHLLPCLPRLPPDHGGTRRAACEQPPHSHSPLVPSQLLTSSCWLHSLFAHDAVYVSKLALDWCMLTAALYVNAAHLII